LGTIQKRQILDFKKGEAFYKMKDNNTVLVTLMNSKTDFEIANTFNWYRIPVKSAPPIVKQKSLKYIAFYHTSIFESLKFSIRWYAYVKNITIKKRKELLPDLIMDPKADNEYYKIEFGPLISLPHEIFSLRNRRILFIPTTEEKFFNANEINYLFHNSPLEDLLWAKFISKNISAERQYLITIDKKNFLLDFALLCKTRNIDIECDGDRFHTNFNAVQYDKRRSNLLEKEGWSVLRFTTEDLHLNFDNSMNVIYQTINKYGGMQEIGNTNLFRYISPDDERQLKLFD